MNIVPIKRALISVFDKKGLNLVAEKLQKHNIEIISSGGTAQFLKKYRIKVQEVSAYTGFPELMNGRVKTLHPKIHAAILGLRDNPVHQEEMIQNDIKPIDLVIVNLYPFEETLANEDSKEAEIIEMIDIGGPSILRSAAKNFHFVTVISDPKDYSRVFREIERFAGTTLETRRYLAAKAFQKTYRFDRSIYEFLSGISAKKELIDLHYEKVTNLRYGENPHQKAVFFRNPQNHEANVTNAKVLCGKQLSFNNILDSDAAIELVREFSNPTAVFVKHTNPCGVASHPDLFTAFKRAFQVDPMSAYGCVIALNRNCTAAIANYILKKKLFVEIIAAPRFEKDALKLLRQKKSLRLLEIGTLKKALKRRDIKKVAGGILVQTADTYIVTEKDLRTVTKKKPSRNQIRDLLFAQQVVKHVKSNAVVFVKKQTTTGIGAGQMSRVDSVFIAAHKGAKQVPGSVMASDAFFPFPDAVTAAHKAGISAIIQPGGSIRDPEVIKEADKLGIAMVFSGIRTFHH